MLLIERMSVKGRVVESDEKLPKGVLARGEWPTCNIGVLNQNNRMYEKKVWDRVQEDENIKEKIAGRKFFGEAEHPKETASDLTLTSHIVTEMFYETAEGGPEVLWSKVDLLDTPAGRIINTLLEAECEVGVSTRAEGDLEECEDDEHNKYHNVISESYDYRALDFTADPSTYGTAPRNVQQSIMKEVKEGMICKNKDDRLTKTFAKHILENMTLKNAKKVLKEILEAKECAENSDCVCSGCGKCDKKDTKESITCPICQTVYESEKGPEFKDCPKCRDQAKEDDKKEITIESKDEPEGMSLEQLINHEYIKLGLGAVVVEKKEEKPGKVIGIKEGIVTIELEDGTQIETETGVLSGDTLTITLPDTVPEGGAEELLGDELLGDELEDELGDELPLEEPAEEELLGEEEPAEEELLGDELEDEEAPLEDEEEDEEEDEFGKKKKKKNPFESKVFENYEEMVDFIANHVKDMPAAGLKALGKAVKVTILNENKTSSGFLKDIRKLRISEASAKAESEEAFTLLDEVDAKLESIGKSHAMEIKILNKKLEAGKLVDEDIKTLSAGITKRTASLKEARVKLAEATNEAKEKINVYEKQLKVKDKEYETKLAKKIKEVNKAHEKNLVETYVQMRLNHSGLKIHENSQALLEKCTSTTEADEVFEQIVDALRRGALRPDKVDKIQVENHIQESKKESEQEKINNSINLAGSSM